VRTSKKGVCTIGSDIDPAAMLRIGLVTEGRIGQRSVRDGALTARESCHEMDILHHQSRRRGFPAGLITFILVSPRH
jgi:hypothetical protein